ncbi:MAG: hypothetical protein C4527_21165 [Candidatus Omnitrophota bacterium]|jgi:aminopeptidase N|nr:MAG: hypothetical protein C4527_21165 [Candidatus Omnitrophota bacterium]
MNLVRYWIRLLFIACLFADFTAGFPDHAASAFPPKLKDDAYPRHYRPDRSVDFEHMRLEIKVFMSEKRIEGTIHYRFRPLHDNVRQIRFDAEEMKIQAVQSPSGRDVKWNHADNALHVTFPAPLAYGQETEIAIQYAASPAEGMYFTDSKHVYPQNPDQLYTLVEPYWSSRWYPCVDYPNDRMVTEMIVTAPKEFDTLSNGLLVKSIESGEWRTDHWKQEIPHVVYLVSLVVGKFDVVKDEWRGVPVEYYVEKGRGADARPSMGKTPEMIECFSNYYGCPYPYEKYAQVAVRYFGAGGMEHTTATTLHEFAVIDEEARLDHDEDWLIAHELAHQWFGDYVTCKSWGELWLNEGFATYSECIWAEHVGGRDLYLDHLWDDMKSYIGSSRHYTRAIVTNQFDDADEMFDSHSYPKAGCVLHMLRDQLGDVLFRKCLSNYLSRFAPGLVDTDDFMEIIEETTGRPMDRFFEQWIYRPGHPKIQVTHEWLPESKRVKLTVKQTQTRAEGEPPFAFPLEVEIDSASESIRQTFEITKLNETLFLAGEEAPKSVVIDPFLRVLMEVEHEKSEDMLLHDLQYGSSVIVKMKAIQALAQKTSGRVIDALIHALNHNHFWRIQEEAAYALSKIHFGKARKALLDACNHPNPKIRRAVVSSLGKYYKNNEVNEALKHVYKNDDSIHVIAEAVRSLSRNRAEGVYTLLRGGLERESYRYRIRLAALDALVDLDEAKVYPALVKFADDPYPRNVRTSAMRGMGKLAYKTKRNNKETLDLLLKYMNSPAESIRDAAIDGLRALRDENAIPPLQRIADDDPNKHIREQAQSAINAIRQERGSELSAENAKKVEELEKKIEKLHDTMKELTQKIDDLSQ